MKRIVLIRFIKLRLTIEVRSLIRSEMIIPRFRYLLIAPFRVIRDSAELRRLRRRMPTTPRMWVREPRRLIRPENDAEYLVRLRQLAAERFPREPAGGFLARGILVRGILARGRRNARRFTYTASPS